MINSSKRRRATWLIAVTAVVSRVLADKFGIELTAETWDFIQNVVMMLVGGESVAKIATALNILKAKDTGDAAAPIA